MFVRHSLLLSICVVLLAASVHAQNPHPRPAPPIEEPPGRMLQPVPPAFQLGPDSVKFKAAFAKLWPILKPTVSPRSRLDERLQRLSVGFATRGIDSNKAKQAVMATFDSTVDQKIMMATFVRSGFTTQDLETLNAFLQTPTGRKYLASDTKIHDARYSYIDQYVDRLFAYALTPLFKAAAPPPPPPPPLPRRDSTSNVK